MLHRSQSQKEATSDANTRMPIPERENPEMMTELALKVNQNHQNQSVGKKSRTLQTQLQRWITKP